LLHLFPLWHAPANVWCWPKESHVHDATPASVQPITAAQGTAAETAQAATNEKSSAIAPQSTPAFKKLSPEEKQYLITTALTHPMEPEPAAEEDANRKDQPSPVRPDVPEGHV
jgi:hypothetical protein